ncbi:MAG TPA: class I SAM-dependent methyltransferase [Pirellulales bacterium]|nr:class I SAM-dependent methyltransferase [Pirellulales bacterium]
MRRVLEPEVMDSPLEAADYDAMDHAAVNAAFAADFLVDAAAAGLDLSEPAAEVLDLGTGTAQIPIELCTRHAAIRLVAIDLAESMLAVGRRNVTSAKLEPRIRLELVDAKRLPFADGRFAAVISNSIVHHIPEPRHALAEAIRVTRPGGLIFFRDLSRPPDDATVRRFVETYAAGANGHQRALFDASLRAALSLDEIRALVRELRFAPARVRQTTDRHWTWSAGKG